MEHNLKTARLWHDDRINVSPSRRVSLLTYRLTGLTIASHKEATYETGLIAQQCISAQPGIGAC